MKNWLGISIIIILIGLVGFLAVQNMNMKKKLDEESSTSNAARLKPAVSPETKPSNPPGASPFDKPNVDPLAHTFTATPKGNRPSTAIKFDAVTHDFGRINEGDKVFTKFKFKNTGEYALVITYAGASCGCTVPDWPRDPIRPGESGEISVSFDSHGKHGETEKTVSVTANTEPEISELKIKATVIPKDN